MSSNSFSTSKKPIFGHNFRKAVFICKSCEKKISGFIQNKPSHSNNIVVKIEAENFQCLKKNEKEQRPRVSGDERKILQLEISSKGTSNFWNEAEFFDDEKKLNIGYDNIRKMNSQHRHRFQLAHDLRIDSDASKNIFDNLLPGCGRRTIKGFIQEIHSNPYAALLFCEYQVKMWELVRELNPIWFFDATGNIMARLKNQKEILIYSIVVHDNVKKTSFPIADFLSSANDSITINSFLTKIVERFSFYSFFKKPKVVVTDYSWANIHAISRAFNNLEVIDYINLTFKVLVEGKLYSLTPINTLVYLCSTHFLKNIIDETDRVLKKKDSNEILLTNWPNKSYINDYDETHKVFFVENKHINFVRDSPFTDYFKKFFESNEKETIKQMYYGKNFYYNPGLFKILTKRLHILPLWSGLMFKFFDLNKTRYSNNAIERWFGYFKNKILMTNKRVRNCRLLFLNEVATPLFFSINKKYKDFYEEKFNINYGEKTKKSVNIEESKASTENYAYKHPIRKKSSYYEKGYDFLLFEDDEVQKCARQFNISDLKISNLFEDDEEEETKMEFQEKINSNDVEQKPTPLKSDEFCYSSELMNCPLSEDVSDKIKTNFTKIFFHINEFNIQDIFYYKVENILINSREINNLLNKRWLSDTILEAYGKAITLNRKKKYMYITSFHCTEISYNGFLRVKNNFQIDGHDFFYGFLNENNNHWCLIFINLNRNTFLYIDPKGEILNSQERFFENWRLKKTRLLFETMIQINEKRRSSDSNECEEQKQGAFSSIKTFIISKSRKPENINDNDIIFNSNDQKLLIKLQESPRKTRGCEVHKLISSVKDGILYRTSTPSGERSFVDELQNKKEDELKSTTDEVFISSKSAQNFEKIENKMVDSEELMKNFDLLILEKDTKIRFYENDINKLQNRYDSKCLEIKFLMEKYERIEIDLYDQVKNLKDILNLKDINFEKKIQSLEQQLMESNNSNKSLYEKNIELENEKEQLQSKRKCPLDKICKSEGNTIERYKTHQIKLLENELLIVREQNQENVIQIQTKFDKLLLEKNNLENQVNESKEISIKAFNKVNSLKNELDNYKNKNDENEQKIKNLEQEINSAHEEKRNIEILNTSLLAEKINNETILKSLRDEIQLTGIKNSKKIDSLQLEINRLEDEKKIQGLLISAEEKNRSLKIDPLLQQIKQLNDQNNYFKNCENNYIEKIQSLEKILADSKNLVDLNERKISEIEAIYSKEKEQLLKEYQEKISNFEATLKNSEDLLKKSDEEKEKLNKEKLDLVFESQRASEKISELLASFDAKEKLKEENDAVLRKNNFSLETLNSEKRNLENQVKKQEEEVNEQKNENLELINQNRRISDELEKNNADFYTIQNQQKELNNLNIQLDTEKNLKEINLKLKQDRLNYLNDEAIKNTLKINSLEKELSDLKKNFKMPNNEKSDFFIFNSKKRSCPYHVCGGNGNVDNDKS
ncbi:unnamed protein product, partial [Brachionus calyciflorus]